MIVIASSPVLFAFPSAGQTPAAQIYQSAPATNKAASRFSLKLNTAFKNEPKIFQQDAQDNLDIVWSLFGENLSRAQELGFGTDPKATKVSPIPFLILHVGLKDLRGFTPDKDVSDLLIFTNQLLFPIEINNKVTSSITLRLLETQKKTDHGNKETGLRLARWGLPRLIKQLTAELPPDTLGFLVSIPSLNRKFLGYDDSADLKLVPLASDRLFQAGKPLPAKEVFLRLVEEAKSGDESPR